VRSTDVTTGPGQARSKGASVQDILAGDATPPPDVLREVSYEYLGSDDIPRERYISKEWHDLEVERLWRRCWQVACREEELANVGDTCVYEVADASLVLVRTSPDRIKAFHNSCLHRGATLRTCDGNTSDLRCGFHGFTWDLDGALKSSPCGWDFPHVDPAQFRLPEALVDTWGGWVFVNMDLDAMSLGEYLGDFPANFPWAHEDFSKQVHVARVIACNWKVALEAFIESFHVIATHPQLLNVLGDANTQYDVYPGQPRWNRMITPQAVQSPHLPDELSEQQIMDAMIGQFLGEGAYFPVAEGQTARSLLGMMVRGQVQSIVGPDVTVSESEALDAIEYYVFPNFVPWGGYARINYRFRPYGNDPDHCIMDVMLLSPLAPGKPRPAPAKVRWLEPDEEWTEAPELGALGAIFNQDMGNLPNIQRGLHASRKPGVTLGNYQEIRIRHYHQELARWVSDGPQGDV
jgi:phenylpropionate dioxygenase-like ring-hydroxylating dioxygenase large terminal subunit